MSGFVEEALTISCGEDSLAAVFARPFKPRPRAVLLVVGGPQYRVGSHRQFTLLARALAADGTPVLRFDYRGMGDSTGEMRNFEDIDQDIRAAVDVLCDRAGVEDVALWGLCDAASAIMLYAPSDARVTGMVLLNPWVRTESGLARARVKHYYLGRIAEAAFWKKVLAGDFDLAAASRSLRSNMLRAWRVPAAGEDRNRVSVDLPSRMVAAWNRFGGSSLLILSGNDITAQEFRDVAQGRAWRAILDSGRVTRHELPGANHTFARREWRNQVEVWTRDWVRSW